MVLTNRSAPPATVTPVLQYADVPAAATWLEDAFGFEPRVRIGEAHRVQMRVGTDACVVVAERGAVAAFTKLRVPDVDAAFARALAAGAEVVEQLTTWEYGERSGVVADPAGHRWELTQTVRDVAPEEWGGTAIGRW